MSLVMITFGAFGPDFRKFIAQTMLLAGRTGRYMYGVDEHFANRWKQIFSCTLIRYQTEAVVREGFGGPCRGRHGQTKSFRGRPRMLNLLPLLGSTGSLPPEGFRKLPTPIRRRASYPHPNLTLINCGSPLEAFRRKASAAP